MRRKFILLTPFLLLSATQIFAQSEGAPAASAGTFSVSLLQDDASGIVLQMTLDGISQEPVSTSRGPAVVPGFREAARILVQGAPDLPRAARSVISDGPMAVEIISSAYTDYDNVLVAPSKGNFTRDIDPASVARVFGAAYDKEAFYPQEAVETGQPYTLRDFNGLPVYFQPVQYNPVSKVMRVYSSIVVRLRPLAPVPASASASGMVLPEYHQTYLRHFLNYSASKYTALSDVGSMLIISHAPFMNAMQPFVEWKIQRGMPVEMVSVATAGSTAAAIKTYISNYFNTHPGLAFVLLVGDAAQVPTNTVTAGHSDNAYGYLVGNDSYPELIIGRFSAETVGHVETMVTRSLNYEKGAGILGPWLTNNIGIASDEGPGDDNEMDFQHVRNIQTDLMNYTYASKVELFEGTQGGVDAPGDPTAAMVSTAINQGTSIISYTGHGSNTSWGTSGFSNTNVQALTNLNKLPFIFSVACVNGNFVGNTCFAEAWTRSTYSDAPVGAVATLMSTINQSWNPPMDGQDEMIDILVETYANNIKRSFGGIAMNGCMHMNDQYGSGGAEMTDTWTIFGDPSLIVRTASPVTITAQHNPVMPLGSSQFLVNANLNGAKAVLSSGSAIISTADVVAGIANFAFQPLTMPDTVTLVVWAYNAIPYIAEVPLIPASGPYVVFDGKQINDATGNGNSLADYGENVSLNISLGNVGISQADSVYAILSSTDPYVTITDSLHLWGNIGNGASLIASSAFSVTISDSVPDQHAIQFKLSIHDNTAQTWVSYFSVTAQAPVIWVTTHGWDDSKGGNGNGKPEPGEVVELTVMTTNKGHSDSPDAKGSLQSLLPTVGIYNPFADLGSIAVGDTVPGTFIIFLDTNINLGTMMNLNFLAKAGAYGNVASLSSRLGVVSEDFETGNLTKFSWNTTGNNVWSVVNTNVFEGSFSARSGSIGHNQSSVLSINMAVANADSISFWKKVSCENGSASGQKWDYLEFFIDNVSMGWWDGEVNWSKHSYPVSAGNHNFKWMYAKDPYVAAGSDCAWLDYIVFPTQGNAAGWKSFPYLVSKDLEFVPAAGNGNIYPEPGESFYLDLKLLNLGQAVASGAKVTLVSNDIDVLVTDSVELPGIVAARDSAMILNGFHIAIPASLNVDKTVSLKLTLSCDTARQWAQFIPFRVYGASTGLAHEAEPGMLNIWPNPASEMLYCRVPSGMSGEILLDFMDITGAVVISRVQYADAAPGQVLTLQIPIDLSAGAYLLRVSNSRLNLTGKVLLR